MFRIVKRKRRYWWPHPFYREAKRFGYPCLHRWLPCADRVIGYEHYAE